MRRSRRSTVPAATIAALLASLMSAAPALAAPTTVTWPVFIRVAAAPGTVNDIDITYRPTTTDQGTVWDHYITDEAGITTVVTDGPTCYPEGPNLVTCPDGTGLQDTKGLGEDFHVFLGDENDIFNAASVGEFEVHAGAGNDIVIGNDDPSVQPATEDEPQVTYYTQDALFGDGGNDRISGRRGPDSLAGGAGADVLIGGNQATNDDFGAGVDDTFQGGPGNDKLIADHDDRDQFISCGPGRRDKAFIDRIDPRPRRCEIVRRS
jgi:Ca2+-binding RTX toxin-like protein